MEDGAVGNCSPDTLISEELEYFKKFGGGYFFWGGRNPDIDDSD